MFGWKPLFSRRPHTLEPLPPIPPAPPIQPHEILQIRSDEQIIFTSGNKPLRRGRAMFFRRNDMTRKVAKSRFGAGSK
ncbi:type IV secretory system conjugative DNA transfer family protein [Roseibium aggregatum]|uniref:type IV secretory system conjugative DNA transfer family protein n=1 Tax=Roseibium aggregatum TaxID=187304 RepID=UPI0012F50D43